MGATVPTCWGGLLGLGEWRPLTQVGFQGTCRLTFLRVLTDTRAPTPVAPVLLLLTIMGNGLVAFIVTPLLLSLK